MIYIYINDIPEISLCACSMQHASSDFASLNDFLLSMVDNDDVDAAEG